MPDKRPLSASGIGHADSDSPDKDYTGGKANPALPERWSFSFLHHVFN